MRTIVISILIGLLLTAAWAATPPDRINYQGVLRDSADNPIDTTHDAVFRVFDAETLGSEVLIDQHLIAGTGGVTFDNGLFNAAIGGGNVLDGSGAGVYTSLTDVFRDYSDLWIEIEINGEALSPRVAILAAGHALNADHAEKADDAASLGGLPASSFLDTSGTGQTKSGTLTVNGNFFAGNNLDVSSNATVGGVLDVNSTEISIGPAPTRLISDGFSLTVIAGDDPGDDILLRAGTTGGSYGSIDIYGQSNITFQSGDGNYRFLDSANVERAYLDASGNLQIDGNLTVDGGTTTHAGNLDVNGDLNFGSGGSVSSSATATVVRAGDQSTDDLILQAGSGGSTGEISINGNAGIGFRTNQNLSFRNFANVELADLGSSGDLRILGDMTVTGSDLFFDADKAWLSSSSSSLLVFGGRDVTDDLILRGNTQSQTRINLLGDAEIEFRSDSGTFRFLDTSTELASLNSAGDLQIDGDLTVSGGTLTGDVEIAGDMTVSGGNLFVGSGSELLSASTSLVVYGGTAATDDLFLRANKGSLDTVIEMYGDSEIEFESGIGRFEFWDRSPSNALAGLLTASAWDISGEVRMDGGDLYMVYTGSDQTQDIHFREAGSSSGERFQWDDAAHRFEVSDDFHAFGTLTATTKNFVQNHPYRDDLEIVYTSLEGDEATAFTRGFGRLVDGEARVALGETFAWVVNPDLGLSAHLTPRGEWADLYVAELTADELVVRAGPGAPDVAFDFVVFGLRIGHEDFPVLRPKRAEAFLPPDGAYDDDRGGDTALAQAAALARYQRMAQQALGLTDIDFSRARELKQAIGQRPVDFDYPVGSDRSMREIMQERHAEELADSDPVVNNEPDELPEVAVSEDAGIDETAGGADATAPATMRRDGDGNVYANSFRPFAGEVATLVQTAEPVEAGDVVVIDPFAPGSLALSRQTADAAVFGVVAADPGLLLGSDEADGETGDVPVATSGIVLCKVDASYGAIRPGDLLTTSETVGHAMRAVDPRPGTVIGKALEPLDGGTGAIRILVTLR